MENNAFEEDFADATSVLRASNAGLLKMSGWDHRTVGTPNDLDWPGGMEDLKSFADRVKAEANAELLLKVQKPCPITSSDEFLHPPRRDTLAWGDGTLVGALGAADDTMSITPSKEAKARFAGAMVVDGSNYYGRRLGEFGTDDTWGLYQMWNSGGYRYNQVHIGDEVIEFGEIDTTHVPWVLKKLVRDCTTPRTLRMRRPPQCGCW